MIISKLNNYENIEKFPKLDEIEKIQKASKKKHENLTETVEQTVKQEEASLFKSKQRRLFLDT